MAVNADQVLTSLIGSFDDDLIANDQLMRTNIKTW